MVKIRCLLVACACAAVFAVLAFLNNLVAIVNWWRAFLAAGGDSSGVNAQTPGLFPWLDWSAVDYSAVTTLIPAVGLVCMTRALCGLLRGRRMRADDFPFFRGSDQLNVALGLFGTLWGIIVIGYFKLDTVSMADLMQCLHTALFSTLTAVVWVFMVDRPLVRPYFTRLLERSGLAETDESDLADAVGRLVVRLGEASDAFDRRQQVFERAFEGRQACFEKAYEARQAEFIAAFRERFAAFAETVERQQKTFEAAFDRRQKSATAAFEKRQADGDAAFRRRMAELDAFCQGRLAAYERECEARQKEYVEIFRRRIEELQASAAESRQRADAALARAAAADARLKAVTVALHG
ncbi:MAG: hypothetical protein ACI4R9_00190 [Kiritimatiellia bacterium]